MGKTVNLGLIQMTCSDDAVENVDKAIAAIRDAAGRGAQIICLQELFRTRYFPQVEDSRFFALAEAVREDSPTVQQFGALAADLKVVIVASLFERRAAGLYHNTAVALDADGRYLGQYRKMHIPDDPHYYEKFYFAPGDQGYRTFRTRYADLGVLICWDQWFPEAARLTAMRGAEIILIPTAIGWRRAEIDAGGPDPDYHVAWEIVQRGHAAANACFVAAVNRVGYEPAPDGGDGIVFWGRSFVADPYGRVVQKAAEDQEAVLICPVDLAFMRRVRDGFGFPFRDRRTDSYGDLTKLYLDA